MIPTEERPKNEFTFHLSYKGEGGHLYEGQFTVKRLSIRDRSRVGVKKSQLSGGMYCVRDDNNVPTGQGLDEDTDYLNSMLAHLEVALIQRPQWFDLETIADLGLVREVYEKVCNFELTFFRPEDRKEDSGKPGSVREGNGSAERAQPGPGNHPTEVVGQEVSAALDA